MTRPEIDRYFPHLSETERDILAMTEEMRLKTAVAAAEAKVYRDMTEAMKARDSADLAKGVVASCQT